MVQTIISVDGDDDDDEHGTLLSGGEHLGGASCSSACDSVAVARLKSVELLLYGPGEEEMEAVILNMSLEADERVEEVGHVAAVEATLDSDSDSGSAGGAGGAARRRVARAAKEQAEQASGVADGSSERAPSSEFCTPVTRQSMPPPPSPVASLITVGARIKIVYPDGDGEHVTWYGGTCLGPASDVLEAKAGAPQLRQACFRDGRR